MPQSTIIKLCSRVTENFCNINKFIWKNIKLLGEYLQINNRRGSK